MFVFGINVDVCVRLLFVAENQCGAGSIAMYVCLFFSQLGKINAGG